MPDHCALYARRPKPLTWDLVQPWTEGATLLRASNQALELSWPAVSVTLTATRVEDPAFPKHLGGFLTYLGTRLKDDGPRGFSLLRAVSQSKQVIGITAAPRFDAGGKCEALIRGLASTLAALTFRDQALMDPAGRVVLAADGTRDPRAELPASAAALERKARTQARLATLGTAAPESLPPIDGEDEVVLGSPAETARRTEALFAVAVRGEGLEAAEARALLERWKLWDAASAEERRALETEVLDPDLAVELTWRYESLWALLWALGRVQTLHTPTTVCDVRRAAQLMIEGLPPERIESAQLRSSTELLDEADFTYRAFAAVEDARARGAASPAGFHRSVLIERLRAFNWLTRRQDWDAVTIEV